MFRRFSKDGAAALEQVIIESVNRHGCHVNWIFDEKDTDPPFAYSIGFTKTLNAIGLHGVPEVILFGLPQATAGPAINALLAMCAAGLSLAEGEKLERFFGEYDCIVRMVDESWLIEEFFASALWYHDTQMGQPLQKVAMIVWPDADHKFPWEAGCADWVCADQPALYQPRLAA